MTHYIAIVHKDENSSFGISFPDLPGCFSAADTAEEILPNAIEALEFYAEDFADLPKASSIEEIRTKTDVKTDLANGAYLISVPLLHNTGKSARINITLDKGLLEAIDDAAHARKMTRSGFLAQAATKEIGS
ncbi:MAG: type II toxin-antitoxin system HicB family antitoxin [Pseudomonadota bacterium]